MPSSRSRRARRAMAEPTERPAPSDGAEPEPTPGHLGHRQRLRARFLAGGPEALADYELLELVLVGANPRGDTKPLAKRLLAAFDGDFAEAIAADPERLRRIEGM